ncbi:hypothetical protein BLA60_35290 [Actinophytocola xinjiangensis]|uniref:SnoaL-like domain-containing protein n=1 Tax=Actinophytocola xinjiangensis TaxID=485602 RepID=A0A7Z0WF50_9PSEU|nr:nuclear transport factor 2 family protein [Actinophytocola xinjiangensis]OLF05772.1 hypothetical protein BLA60_35290 [Actinophytocola xinjiangensis]
MSTEENREFVRGIFAQMAAGNGRALTDAMADDITWVARGDGAWSGTWRSKAEVVHGVLLPLLSQFADQYRSKLDRVLADGDHVVVESTGSATTHRGEFYEQTYCYIFRVADRRITEVVEYCDTALTERVLDPPPATV